MKKNNKLKIFIILLLCDIGIFTSLYLKINSSVIFIFLLIFLKDFLFTLFLNSLSKNLTKIILILFCIHSFTYIKYYLIFGADFYFSYISAIKEVKDVSFALASYLSYTDLLFLIAIILSFTIETKFSKNVLIYAGLFFILCSLTAVEKNVIFFGSVQVLTNNLEKTTNYIIEKMSASEKETLENIQSYKYEKSSVEPIFEGRQLILIQCESLDDFAINELTPNIQNLMSKGINFTNYHAPTYAFHTICTEFFVLTGQIPSGNTIVNYTYVNNSFPSSLAFLFKEKGYDTKVYHSWKGNYYNRKTFLKKIGFDETYFAEELGLKTTSMEITNDEDLFSKINIDENDFTFIITCSGHGSYNYILNQEYYDLAKQTFPDKTDEELIYQAKIMELDNAIGSITEKYPDAVIIMYADHVPYMMKATENYSDDVVPMVIYANDIEHKEIDKEAYTGDMYLTIAELFGLNIPDCAYFGVNALSDKETYIIEPDDTKMIKLGEEILNTNIYKNLSK